MEQTLHSDLSKQAMSLQILMDQPASDLMAKKIKNNKKKRIYKKKNSK